MDVLLVSMPFGSAFAPSLGLSLLKAGLVNRGISSRVRYFSIRFAELTGQAFYEGIAKTGDLAPASWPGSGSFPAACSTGPSRTNRIT